MTSYTTRRIQFPGKCNFSRAQAAQIPEQAPSPHHLNDDFASYISSRADFPLSSCA